jgi:hypothetical protein
MSIAKEKESDFSKETVDLLELDIVRLCVFSRCFQ